MISGLRHENAVTAWWVRRPAECSDTGTYVLTSKPESKPWLVVRVDFDAPLRHVSSGLDINMILVNDWFYEYEVPESGPVFILHDLGNTGSHPEKNYNLVRVEFCNGRSPLHRVQVATKTRMEDVCGNAGGGSGSAGAGGGFGSAEDPAEEDPAEETPEPPACVACNTTIVPHADCMAGCGHWYHVRCGKAGMDDCAACGFPAERVFYKRRCL